MNVVKPGPRRQLAALGVVFAGVVLSMVAPEALAQTSGTVVIPSSGKTLGQIAQNLVTSLRDAGILVTALSYLGALVFGYIAMLKWKAHGDQPDRTPLKQPITYMLIAAGFAALPEVLGTGIASLWGSGAQVVQQP